MENKRLDFLMAQWTELSGYQEKIDTGHWIVLTIFFASFGLVSSSNGSIITEILLWILPPTIMVVFYVEAYCLREVSVLKKYLAFIEREINKLFSEGVENDPPDQDEKGLFQWYSYYNPRYYSRNNWANKFMSIPILLALCIVFATFFTKGVDAVKKGGGNGTLYIIMLLVTIFFDFLATASILRNSCFEKRIERIDNAVKSQWLKKLLE